MEGQEDLTPFEEDTSNGEGVTETPYVSPEVAAAQAGESVNFGTQIVDRTEDRPAPKVDAEN